VGYAAPGTWAHQGRDWKWGRLVFPHTDPSGRLVNLYGRAVGSANEKVPKSKRHDHLPGQKGYFNAAAPRVGEGPLFVCEGGFDALSLIAAGYPPTVAIYGVDGWRWEWARDVRQLVLCNGR
jgi:DNA primase